MKLRTEVTERSVYLKRPALTSLDREESFYIDVTEVDDLIAELMTVKARMARTKRVQAQRLLAEAEKLDPEMREAA